MELKSSLYECTIMHNRLSPVRHGFTYTAFFFLLDLDDIEGAAARLPLLGHNRWNAFSFREDDHLRYGGASTIESIRRYLREHGVAEPVGKVYLLTNLRTFGYVFNPVSFYFCSTPSGEPLCAIAEVGNTFGEMKPYLLRSQEAGPGLVEEERTKFFYVSPFIAPDARFAFRLRFPDEQLDLRIDGWERGEKVLVTAVRGEQKELTGARLFWYSLRFPFMTLQVITRIHRQAWKLYRKGLPFYRKTAHQHLQQEVFHANHQ